MVTVENAVPTVAAGEDVTAEEGALVSLASSSFNDLGTSDTHIASIDWGDGTPPEVGVIVEAPFGPPGAVGGANGAVSASHVYGDNGVYTVILAVEDDEEASGADICVVTVSNVAPNITNISAPTDPIPAETLITASATFEDLGILDTHLVTWDWGDGTSSEMNIDEDSSIRSVSEDHTYTGAGVYTIGVAVADDEGALDEAIFQFVVIYDPDGGFVTGGGWIDSPPGAYTPEDLTDPDLTGKANFGFVSKYKKGADLPTGNTEFNFHVAELEFHSTEYEWLVVAGAQAKFKGTGTINDDGNYGFMLFATDADLKNQDESMEENSEDKFRIKIWDIDDGDKVIYDNQPGEADDAEPTTTLGGGSIVIHGEKQGKPNAAPAMLPNGTRLLAAYPNPFNPDIWIPYQLGSDSQVTVRIYSLAGHLVRTFDLGTKSAGFYVDRAKAAHWDGRNEAGEYAASGIYFYSLQAGGYTATKKMIVAK